MSSTATLEVLGVGSLVRFDCHEFIGRVTSLRIGEGNLVSYEVEWDADEKGGYVSHMFSADRVTALDLNTVGPVQIGFGGSHPEQGEVVVTKRGA